MERKRLSHLVALGLVLCLLVGALPASAQTLGNIARDIPTMNALNPAVVGKSTTKLTLPKTIKMAVGELKRVNYKLKYKGQADGIEAGWAPNASIKAYRFGSDVIILAMETGAVDFAMASGGKVAKTKILISDKPATGIILTGDYFAPSVGSTYDMNESVLPADAASQVKWSSDRSKVAKVTAKGALTVKSAGTAILTCKTKKGNKLVGTVLVVVS